MRCNMVVCRHWVPSYLRLIVATTAVADAASTYCAPAMCGFATGVECCYHGTAYWTMYWTLRSAAPLI